MHKHHSVSAVQLIPYRSEYRIAEPRVSVARHDRDSLSVQFIEGVLDLTQASFSICKWRNPSK